MRIGEGVPVVADLDESDPPRIALETQFHHRDRAKELPGSSWSSAERRWKVPLAWTTCLALRATFGDELVIGDRLANWAIEERIRRITPSLALREAVTLESEGVPETEIVRMTRKTAEEMGAFKHQAAGAAFTATAEQCLIADETGTGKSAQTILALRVLHRLGINVFPVLIVAPNTVKKTWQREWATWWPGIETSLVRGGAAARRKALETPAHVYIINWDLLAKHSRLAKYGNLALKRCKECGGLDERINSVQCEVHKKELNYLHFETVIADEVHRGKDPRAKWTRALWGAAAESRFRFGLTGTPVQDTIEDLWSILHFLAPEEYPAKTKFMDRFAETGYNMWGMFTVYGIRESKREEFFAGVDTRMRRMLKKVVLPFLPPILREERLVEMSPVQAKAYKQMVKDTIAELEEGSLVATTPLSKATRLMQFASSYAELKVTEKEDGRTESVARLKLPSSKITAFMDDVESGDFGDQSVLVFAKSRQLIDLLSGEMERKKIPHGMITGSIGMDERQRHIDEFQEGKTKFILVTIDAGGVGLTLTAASIMVFLQRSFSSTAMKQAESRAHRIGSEMHDHVTIIDYLSEGTIEEDQLLKLGAKYERIESIVRDRDMLKRLLTDEPK